MKNLPVDHIKVDRSFVSEIQGEGEDEGAIVKGVISMAHAMKLRVVAEGVETEEQLNAALDGVREECARLIGAGKKVIVE